MSKDLAYYKSLPYHLRVERFEEEEDGEVYFRAYYEEIPQVKGIHRDRLLAIRLAKELFDSFIEAQLEWEGEIPEPDTPRFRKRGGLFKFEGEQESRSGTVHVPAITGVADEADQESTSADAAGVPA